MITKENIEQIIRYKRIIQENKKLIEKMESTGKIREIDPKSFFDSVAETVELEIIKLQKENLGHYDFIVKCLESVDKNNNDKM
jgi:hypothetical protein